MFIRKVIAVLLPIPFIILCLYLINQFFNTPLRYFVVPGTDPYAVRTEIDNNNYYPFPVIKCTNTITVGHVIISKDCITNYKNIFINACYWTILYLIYIRLISINKFKIPTVIVFSFLLGISPVVLFLLFMALSLPVGLMISLYKQIFH